MEESLEGVRYILEGKHALAWSLTWIRASLQWIFLAYYCVILRYRLKKGPKSSGSKKKEGEQVRSFNLLVE